MENEENLSGMGAEETLMTSQGNLKSVINTLEILDDYLSNTNVNETSLKVSSILTTIIPILEEIYQDNENIISMLNNNI